MNLWYYDFINGQGGVVSAGLNVDLATIVAGVPMGEMLRSFVRIDFELLPLI